MGEELNKLRELKRLHNKAWKLRSIWVRLRDGCICITCGIKCEFKKCNAGHFVHGKRYNYLEENTNCQCVRDNLRKHGDLGRYAVNLDKKWGPGTAQGLIAFEDSHPGDLTVEELNIIIHDLESKISEFNRTKI